MNVVVPPLAVDGPCVTIRRFGARRIPLGALCPPGVEELLAWCVRARSNVIVSGGTGAGKTTVLNALGALLPDGERIVTVEDTAELRLPAAHVVRLEARPATADGAGRHHDPPARAQRPAHAARPHHRRRGPGPGGGRHVVGDEHGPRGLAVHVPRQLARSTPCGASR